MDNLGQGPVAPNRLTREQKIGFFLLLVFGFFSVVLGMLQIRNTIHKPFAVSNKVPGFVRDQVVNVDTLRFRDTDQDTISDYDELYLYQTSPYLADTDSDGINDKQEIEKGTSPTCPAGQDCDNAIAAGDSTLVKQSVTSTVALGVADIDAAALFSDPKQLRQILVAAGIKADVLAKISDKDLVAMVSQTINSSTTLKNNLQGISNLIKNQTTP